MTKSKTKSSILRSTQGDFRFQTNCHAFASCTPRVHSRSCSPVQYGFISPSPTSTPPRTKVVFANFVDFSSLARVSSKRKYKTMQKNGFLAQSLHPPSSGGCNGRSYSCSRTSPLPTKRLVEYNPSGSCLGLGGLNPTLSIVSPSQPSFGKSHPSSFPSGVTPSPIGATSFASPVKDKSLPGYSRGLSTVREEDGSLVANGSTSLDGFFVEGCSNEEDLKENQLDFTFSEEEYEKYSPSSPAPAIPVILASPKGANLDPSKTENVGKSHSTPLANGRWRYMFSSNRNIFTCSKLKHFSTYNDIQSYSLLAKDLDHTSDDCKLYAVGYVSGKFSGYRALNDIIGNT
uniref:Uncharacterized protein n=1 Tax=Populus alba TaxID=43335 RepID=A0A4U5QXQ9_POPAL|nr:hypothetical protein D5086_0000026350 [Populus alba]